MACMVCIRCKREVPDGPFCNQCGSAQQKKPTIKRRGNGQGTAVKRGKTWTAIWTESAYVTEDKKYHQKRRWKGGFSTQTKALAYASNPPERPQKKEKTIRVYYNGWKHAGYLKLSESKQESYDIAWNKIKEIADRPISKISIDELQAVINKKAKTHYPARDIRTLLSHLYRRAVAEGEAHANLASYLQIPELNEAEGEPFLEKEVESIWKAFNQEPDIILAHILIMIYTGMMPGELLRMTTDMIHWDENTIVGCALKTKKRKTTPTVFPDFLRPILEYACEEVGDGNRIVGMSKNQFYDAYHATVQRIGIRDLPPYSCRHTTGTALALADTAPFIIKEVMRHTKITTTQRYIHPGVEASVAAVNTMKK